jgi:hypothetical protein
MIIITFNSIQSSMISIKLIAIENNVKMYTVHSLCGLSYNLVGSSLEWFIMAENSQSMFFIIMMRADMLARARAYRHCRDCKIITLNTIKNKKTCVCVYQKKSDIDN